MKVHWHYNHRAGLEVRGCSVVAQTSLSHACTSWQGARSPAGRRNKFYLSFICACICVCILFLFWLSFLSIHFTSFFVFCFDFHLYLYTIVLFLFVWEYHFLLLVCFYICNWFDGLILKLLIKLYTAKLWDKVSLVFCIFKPHFCVNRQSVDCLTFATGNGQVSGLNQSTPTNLLSAAKCWMDVYLFSCLCVYFWIFFYLFFHCKRKWTS